MVGTVNANRDYFETGVEDLSAAVHEYGDWVSLLLTHPVPSLAHGFLWVSGDEKYQNK